MDPLTCTICDDAPVFTEEAAFWEHLEVAHLIHHHEGGSASDLEKVVNSILYPN